MKSITLIFLKMCLDKGVHPIVPSVVIPWRLLNEAAVPVPSELPPYHMPLSALPPPASVVTTPVKIPIEAVS